MEHSSLSELIDALEKGTNLHISVAFQGNCGNQKTRCRHDQTIHNQPVCLAVKGDRGLSGCYRCRYFVQKTVIAKRRPMAGVCTGGVYEYVSPVICNDRVCCVIFVGNILTDDLRQRQRLEQLGRPELLQTMEKNFSKEDCIRVSKVLESYIRFLLERYGMGQSGFDPLVENIKNYIRENLASELSIVQLAEAFGYTEKYMGRLFKTRTGQTVTEYINGVKISNAKKLLTETKLNIDAIALQTGFNSVTYFDRVFHKITGVSPQTYRKSVLNRRNKH